MTPTPVPLPTKYRSDFRNTVLSGKKFYNVDLSGQDLSKLKMRSSTFYQCRFDNADCTETDFTGSDLFGSSMIDTICYRTNFADAKLTSTNFQPKDCFGMTITMCCRTFQDMKISPLWWLGLATFLTMTHPIKGTSNEDLNSKLIGGVFGAERYAKLRALYSKRDLIILLTIGMSLLSGIMLRGLA